MTVLSDICNIGGRYLDTFSNSYLVTDHGLVLGNSLSIEVFGHCTNWFNDTHFILSGGTTHDPETDTWVDFDSRTYLVELDTYKMTEIGSLVKGNA